MIKIKKIMKLMFMCSMLLLMCLQVFAVPLSALGEKAGCSDYADWVEVYPAMSDIRLERSNSMFNIYDYSQGFQDRKLFFQENQEKVSAKFAFDVLVERYDGCDFAETTWTEELGCLTDSACTGNYGSEYYCHKNGVGFGVCIYDDDAQEGQDRKTCERKGAQYTYLDGICIKENEASDWQLELMCEENGPNYEYNSITKQCKHNYTRDEIFMYVVVGAVFVLGAIYLLTKKK
jgi:hypothetical protein